MLERDAARTLELQSAWQGADRFAVPLALLALRAAFDAWTEHPAGESLGAAFRRTCAALRTAATGG